MPTEMSPIKSRRLDEKTSLQVRTTARLPMDTPSACCLLCWRSRIDRKRMLMLSVCMQTLNSRLEQYVLRVNEMEDSKLIAERELETIRMRMQSDIDKLKLRLSSELEETRKCVIMALVAMHASLELTGGCAFLVGSWMRRSTRRTACRCWSRSSTWSWSSCAPK